MRTRILLRDPTHRRDRTGRKVCAPSARSRAPTRLARLLRLPAVLPLFSAAPGLCALNIVIATTHHSFIRIRRPKKNTPLSCKTDTTSGCYQHPSLPPPFPLTREPPPSHPLTRRAAAPPPHRTHLPPNHQPWLLCVLYNMYMSSCVLYMLYMLRGGSQRRLICSVDGYVFVCMCVCVCPLQASPDMAVCSWKG